MARKPLNLAFLIVVTAFVSHVSAQTKVWQPSGGRRQILIWPGTPPDAQSATAPESMDVSKRLIAGKHFLGVYNVTKPTITLYPPKRANTGVAVLVFPGGGYKGLAIDLEGTEICEWLAAHGITGVLLKYRVPFSGHYWNKTLKRHVNPKAFTALEDAQRAMRLLRRNAKAWHIDPHKIGVVGFSAGGHMVAAISTHFSQRLYPAMDAAEKESCRPDFAIAAYPGHLWSWTPEDNPNFDLNPDIAKNITKQTPPTFLIQAQDDPVDNVNDSLVYYIALKNAGVPVEMHLFAQGGHAFGLRRTSSPITNWPSLVMSWLKSIRMLS
jgi:acetyl esterase/lipase